MKWPQFWNDKGFWIGQLWIAIATTVPFIGSFVLLLFVEDRFKFSYEKLLKPSWAPSLDVKVKVLKFRNLKFDSFQVLNLVTMLVLSAFGYGSYRVCIFGGPFYTKTFLSLLFFSLTLMFEWLKVIFGPTQLDFAAVHSSVILFFAIITGLFFFYVDKTAGIASVPYILWLTFSTALVYNLWLMNCDGDWFANREAVISNVIMKNKMLKS